MLPNLPEAVLTVNLSLGRTFTVNEKEGGWLSSITPYLATNYHETFNSGGTKDMAAYDLTPGVRANVKDNIWFVTGVTVPITGPRPFDTQYQFVLVLGW